MDASRNPALTFAQLVILPSPPRPYTSYRVELAPARALLFKGKIPDGMLGLLLKLDLVSAFERFPLARPVFIAKELFSGHNMYLPRFVFSDVDAWVSRKPSERKRQLAELPEPLAEENYPGVIDFVWREAPVPVTEVAPYIIRHLFRGASGNTAISAVMRGDWRLAFDLMSASKIELILKLGLKLNGRAAMGSMEAARAWLDDEDGRRTAWADSMEGRWIDLGDLAYCLR